jgi:phosphoribosylamine--glycine ligase
MKVLVVGGGGREHAIVWSLKKSKKVTGLFCAPGNGGIESIAECVPISVMEFEKLADFAESNDIALTVIGMDNPLSEGIVDYFEERKLKVFGPVKNAAYIESSKAFAKDLMFRHGIPTAGYEIFNSHGDALAYVKTQKMPVVIKADGLALGKGVFICDTLEECETALDEIMAKKVFGSAGETVVIEEFMSGTEISLLCFCDGKTVVPMVSAQDYKRALDDDKGLNTGGMGSVSPSPVMTDSLSEQIVKDICIPTVKAMAEEGREFKGVLYAGLMMTGEGVKVVEYNARFGDPETQVILPRLKTDLFDILMAVADGRLNEIDIEWSDEAFCCVVLASGGYPQAYGTGYEIKGTECGESALVFHAATAKKDGKLVTAGGRVLGVTASGKDVNDASKNAYKALSKISFENMYFRKDIGVWAK